MYTGYTNYHTHGNSHVWQMDNLTAMRQMPDKYYQLAIVDPPYGINIANMNMGTGTGKRQSKINNRKWSKKDWDSCAPNSEYFKHLFRVSENQIIWGGNYFPLPPCKNYVVWDKEIPDGLSFADCEMAWTSFSNAPKIFRYSAYLDKKEKLHPTQKPVKLYEWLLKNYAKPGDKILDTHLGSQSSRIAAYKLGFEFHGFELDEEYFNDGNERFKVAVAMPLFDGTMLTAAQCEQKELF